MNNLYLYNASYFDSDKIQKQLGLVYFHHTKFDFDDFLKSLDNYFGEYPLPEKLVLIIPDYLKHYFECTVNERLEELWRVIPTRLNKNEEFDFVQPLYYDSIGNLTFSNLVKEQVDIQLLDQIFNNALVDIFKRREGLIKSENAHHFVFPSGKHCDYFLRPGNILVKGNEIFFIAFTLLSKLKESDAIIYCDTSSINSIALALIELKRRFIKDDFVPPYIESFGSYSAFENNDFTFLKNSLFLVSSSTSSRIIARLMEKKVDQNQIALIFCMGKKDIYKRNIICNLEYNQETNPHGIKPFKSYEVASLCTLCKNGSIPVEVTGDVFQIEKPKLNLIEIKVTDLPKFHGNFMSAFYTRKAHDFSFIKAHAFEAVNREPLAHPSYEIFLDVSGLMENIDKFDSFKEKLNDYITQHIPSRTKFLIHLPDSGSYQIADYIKKFISSSLSNPDEIIMINQNDLFKNNVFKSYKNAVAVVVCSTLVSGSRLLYVSREMREYSNISLIYFAGFTRTEDESYLNFIKNNLTMGKYGISTNLFVEIERIYTCNERLNTSWVVEGQFLSLLKSFCYDVNEDLYEEAITFFDKRIEQLDKGLQTNGLSNNLFYPNVILNKELKINKNFAFYKFKGYRNNASQSDVLFTISVILNALRNSNDHNRKIVNTHFVRTLLEPNNFNRYNDGIIQAALLRTAHSKELSFNLDKKLSFAMLNIIIGIIEFSDQDHGEALIEFLYAIAIKKLKLKDYHIEELFIKIKGHKKAIENKIVLAFVNYCERVTFGTDDKFIEEYSLKLDFQ